MRKLYFLMMLALLPATMYAQTEDDKQTQEKTTTDYTLKGVVKDMLTGQPVKGATLSVPHTPIATSTDDQGIFTLRSKMYFEHIIVSCVGYTNKVISTDDAIRDITIVMEPTAKTLNGVEIIGVKTAQSVTTLSDADLQRASGLSLQDALNNVPGVNMQSRTPWGGQHIIIRGYYPSTDNGRTNGENFGGLGYQMYINNIPVTDATGNSIMDDIDYSMLGRVDIIKGPSPLYGSYIGGAVSLFTPKVEPNQTSVQEQAIGGSYGLFRTNTSIMTSDGKMDLWVNYGHQTYDGFRPNDASRKDFASAAANFYVSSNHTVSAYASYNHSYEDLAGEIDSADFYARNAVSNPAYTAMNSHVEIQSFRAGATDKYRICKHLSNEMTVFTTGSTLTQYYAHGYTKTETTSFGGREALKYEGKTDNLNVNGTLGASFIRSDQNTLGTFIQPFGAHAHVPSALQNYAMNYDLFTQWVFRLPAQQLSLTVGGSLNFVEFGTQNIVDSLNAPITQKVFKPTFTPDVSLLKVLNNNLSVYASLSTGYTPPLLTQLIGSDGNVNASLKPENAIQYEIGTKGTYGKDQRLSYQLALFDLDIKNKLTAVTSGAVTSYANIGEQRNMGLELYVGYSLINDRSKTISVVRPWVSYTYLNAEYTDFKTYGKSSAGIDTVSNNFSNNKVAAVSPNMLNVGLDVASKYGFYLNATYQYVDKAPVTFDNSTYMKSYNMLRARIGYKRNFGRHFTGDIFVGGDNLLSNTYYSFIFVGQHISELAQGGDVHQPGGGGDGYILPAPYNATFYGGLTVSYKF
jgi:iron complex outermembrane recepter protein